MSEDNSTKGTDDSRFSGIYNDPKFRKTKNKNLKIKLDERFSKKDLEIRRKTKVDKYGRKIHEDNDMNNKELKDFDKYFEKEGESADEKKEEEEIETVTVDRARGEVPADYVSSSDEYTSSESEDSGESDLESEGESEIEVDEATPETGDATKTLAVVNLDWDHVRSSDLMITFSGFLPKGGKIEKIVVLPSEFGKERMQREETEGPPRELFQKKKKKGKRASVESDSDDSDVDIKDLYEEGDADKDVDTRALRQYQLERLRYYYAVVYCNSVEAARAIYENCDGTEYESTANMFDLRYVPDGMDFDDEPRDQCSSLPKNYKPHQFSTDALQHSNVKLTWDETPAERVEVAKRAFTQKEIEDMDFKAYLASDSDGSEDEVNQDAKNKLKSLVGDSLRIGNQPIFGSKDTLEGEDEEVDMEITFDPGLSEGVEKTEEHEETTIEKVARKEKERRKARKQKLKELKNNAQKEKKDKLKSLKGKKHNDSTEGDASTAKSKAELELLMMDDEDDTETGINKKAHFNMKEILRSEKEKSKKGKYQDKRRIVEDNFKPDLNDPRFKEVFEDHDFAIDPSRPEFKETPAMKEILKERSKRSSKNAQKKKRSHSLMDNQANETSDISNIVSKLKKKGGKGPKKSRYNN